MLIINYYSGVLRFAEFLFFEHDGFAKNKSIGWWNKNTISKSEGIPVPETTEEAYLRIEREMFMPASIWVKKDLSGYDKVVSINLRKELVKSWKDQGKKYLEEDINF
jgi:hypothetical protein